MSSIQSQKFSQNFPSLEVQELKSRYIEGWASGSGMDTSHSSTYFTFSKFLFEWNDPEWHFTAITGKSMQQIHFFLYRVNSRFYEGGCRVKYAL